MTTSERPRSLGNSRAMMMLVAAMSVFGCGKKSDLDLAKDASESYAEMVKPSFPEAGGLCENRWTAFSTACARQQDVCLLADDFRHCLVDAGTASVEDNKKLRKRTELNSRAKKSLTMCAGGSATFYPDASSLMAPHDFVHVTCRWSAPYAAEEKYHAEEAVSPLALSQEPDVATRR